MKKAIFYITSTAAIAMLILGLGLLGAVDAGAPIFPTYIGIIAAGAASFGLFFIAQSIAIAEGIFLDLTWMDDDGERGI